MAGNRKAYNSQQTREYIKETFLRLYAKKGMQGVSVVSLCNEPMRKFPAAELFVRLP